MPIAIDITRNGHRLFGVALPGSSSDNAAWTERKSRTAQRFGHSSLYLGQLCREAGPPSSRSSLWTRRTTLWPGCPSWMPQLEDPQLVASELRRLLA